MQLKQGTTLQNGRFRIISCIGDGGFGITYLVMDEKLGREVVLKEYFPDYMVKRDTTVSHEVKTLNPGFTEEFHTGIQKFLKEAKMLAQFNSVTAIANVHDFFEENNTAYIVMDYIQGQNLKQLIKARTAPYSFSEALELMKPCMIALQKVHKAGIIHRDFAPDNILIDENGQPTIIDFGSSRDYVTNNATMTIMVKHGYAPVEQYSNAVKQGPYTDVYSLGAIFYEMLTLKKPAPAVDRMIKDSLMMPVEENPLVTPVQSDVVMKGLAISYEMRYQTVDEFLKALSDANMKVVEHNTADDMKTLLDVQSMTANDSATELVRPEQSLIRPEQGLVWPEHRLAVASDPGATEVLSYAQQSTREIVSYAQQGVNKKYSQVQWHAVSAVQERIGRCHAGDTIRFGRYKWKVLAKDNSKVLIIAKEGVGNRAFDSRRENARWETCELRKWLNEDFYYSFGAEEQLLIRAVRLSNNGNPKYGTSGGNETDDRIFLLSIDEAKMYFLSDGDRKNSSFSLWWLRSPGGTDSQVAVVDQYGTVSDYGINCNIGATVRPALCVNIKY